MPSPPRPLCWPTQFLAKWLATFFCALAAGVLVSAVRHRPHDVQAVVRVRIRFANGPWKPVAADISQLAGPGDAWNPSKTFAVSASGTSKTLLNGRQYLKVWPKNAQGQYEGEPVDWPVKWPDADKTTLTEDISRTSRVPDWHRP